MGDDFSPDQALPALVAAYPQLPFIVFSAEDVLARQLLSDGVKGYVVKSDEASSIIRALEALLLEGQPLYCSPRVRREQLLSRRELQVLQLIADGFTTKGAAHQLGISDDAVDEYRKRLFAKLDARSAAQAVAIGMRKGLLR
jgi:two-component system, NarL family, response regulator YdfI